MLYNFDTMHIFNRNKQRKTYAHEQSRHEMLFTTVLLNIIYTAAFLRLQHYSWLCHVLEQAILTNTEIMARKEQQQLCNYLNEWGSIISNS